MSHILIMPRQGNTVESCIITGWKVKEGDRVSPETPVCEVETDKAAFEVPSGAEGTVLKLLRADGDDVPVLEPIAVIGEAGEDWQALLGTGDWGIGNREGEVSPPAPNPAGSPLPPSTGAPPP
jgi:pyruvate dehydrogenase E2 component (dihydrolipoamide acetyltransferase)